MPRGRPVFMTYMRTKEQKHNKEPTRRFLMQGKRKRESRDADAGIEHEYQNKGKKKKKQRAKREYSGYHANEKQGVSQCTVKSRRTPSGMRVVVWVPGRERRGEPRFARAPWSKERSTLHETRLQISGRPNRWSEPQPRIYAMVP